MTTPSSEKIRFEKLRLVCRKALEQSIKKSLSQEQIISCYPTIADSNDGIKSLDLARQQIIKFWFNNSMREFEWIFKERNIELKLDELDELILQARMRSLIEDEENDPPVFINQLTPDQIMEANLIPSKRTTIENLSMIHEQLKLDNQELLDELLSLSHEGESIQNDLYGTIKSLNEGIEGLRGEEEQVRVKLDQLIDAIE